MATRTSLAGDVLPGYAGVRYGHLFPDDPKNASMVHLDGTPYQVSSFWGDGGAPDWASAPPPDMSGVLPEYGT